MDITSSTFLKSIADASQLPRDKKPHVALFGRSNVGKSSLINSLTRHKGLARSSNTPGRTRLINLFDAGLFYLVDLPGYGYTKASKSTSREFQQLILDYLDAEPPIATALLVVDARHEPTEQDRAMAESLASRDVPFAVIANKIDKLSANDARASLKRLESTFPGRKIVAHSAEAATGRGEILSLLRG